MKAALSVVPARQPRGAPLADGRLWEIKQIRTRRVRIKHFLTTEKIPLNTYIISKDGALTEPPAFPILLIYPPPEASVAASQHSTAQHRRYDGRKRCGRPPRAIPGSEPSRSPAADMPAHARTRPQRPRHRPSVPAPQQGGETRKEGLPPPRREHRLSCRYAGDAEGSEFNRGGYGRAMPKPSSRCSEAPSARGSAGSGCSVRSCPLVR